MALPWPNTEFPSSEFPAQAIPPLRDIAKSFSPLTLYQLRKQRGADFLEHQTRYLASDLAWFAAGCSTDGDHDVPVNRFHQAYLNMSGCPKGRFLQADRYAIKNALQHLTFDLATLWDRAFGGSTLIIHVDGPGVPGAPYRPEFTKALVYLPPCTVVKELPEAHPAIAAVVQTFIEAVGVPTRQRWATAGRRHLGYDLSPPSDMMPPNRPPKTLLPIASSRSALLTFEGRPKGSLLLPASSTPAGGSTTTQPTSPSGSEKSLQAEDYSASFLKELAQVEQSSKLDEELRKLSDDFQERELMYLNRIQLLEATIAHLEEKIEILEPLASSPAIVDDASSSAAVPKTPTRPEVLGAPTHSGPKFKTGSAHKEPRKGTPRASFQHGAQMSSPTPHRVRPPATATSVQTNSHPVPATPEVTKHHHAQAIGTSLNSGNSIHPAVAVADQLGYDKATRSLILLLMQKIAPQYWQRNLEDAGVKADDLVQILDSMGNDEDDSIYL